MAAMIVIIINLVRPLIKWGFIIMLFPITLPWLLFHKWCQVKYPEIWLVNE